MGDDEAGDAADIVDANGDLETTEEDEDTMNSSEIAVLKKAASTSAGFRNILKNLADDSNACGLTRAQFDEIVIEHCEVNNKNLTQTLERDPLVVKAYKAVAHANGVCV